MASVVKLSRIGYQYPGSTKWLFQNIDLEVSQGSVLAIVGPSGCGKSTLLRIIGGLLPPTCGNVTISRNGHHLPSAFMFQDGRLLPWRRCLSNVLLGCERTELTYREKKERSSALLQAVVPEDVSRRFPHQLSGGQRQRVAFARALVSDAPLLLLDEPFSALDYETKREIVGLLRNALVRGTAVVIVTHDLRDAELLKAKVMNISP